MFLDFSEKTLGFKWFILSAFILGRSSVSSGTEMPKNKLLLISFDGFRWDYIHKTHNLTSFHRMISDGAWATKGIKNVFLTKTIPNHYTIVTGLFEESHGMVGNVMFDPVLNKTFYAWVESDEADSQWWDNGGEPIWVTNQRQSTSHRSGVMGWPGGLARVKGFAPYREVPWTNEMTNQSEERAHQLIKWFTDEYPINLGLYYHDQPDHIGHQFGPDSDEMTSKIVELDSLLGYILDELDEHKLLNKVNIILTSDHGMTFLPNDTDHMINLTDYIQFETYNVTSTNPVAGIFPHSLALEEEIFKNLSRVPHAKVYRRKDIPNEYHFKNNRRTPPIILEPEEHYWISYNNSKHIYGEHGYNNSLQSMHPVFLAMGPDFKPGAKVDTFNNVDIYPLMCKLLGLTPAPNNGSMDVVAELLNDTAEETGTFTFAAYIVIVVFIGLVSGVFSVAACQVHRQYKRRLRLVSGLSLPLTMHYSKSDRKDRKPLMSSDSEDELDVS